MCELLRKLILTSLVMFFNSGSPLQVAFALLVSWLPFKSVDRNASCLQHCSQSVTTLLFAFGLLFKVSAFANVDEAQTDRDAGNAAIADGLGIVLVVMCSAFLVACVVAGVLEMARKVNAQLIARARFKGVVGGGISGAVGVPGGWLQKTQTSSYAKRTPRRDGDGDGDLEMQAIDDALFELDNPMHAADGGGRGRGGIGMGGGGGGAVPKAQWRANPLAQSATSTTGESKASPVAAPASLLLPPGAAAVANPLHARARNGAGLGRGRGRGRGRRSRGGRRGGGGAAV